MRERHEIQAVIFSDSSEKNILIVSKKTIKGKGWRLLKGGIEDGENAHDALLREIKEEIGLVDVKPISKVQTYDYIHGTVKHFVTSFAVKAKKEEKIRIDKREITGYRWVDSDEAVNLLKFEVEKESIRLFQELDLKN